MNDETQTHGERGRPTTPLMSRPLAAIGLAGVVATPIVINLWMVHIRNVWIETYPEKAAARPPTVSRAMADLPLGDVMGIWLTVAALALLLAGGIVSLLYARTIHVMHVPHGTPRRRLRWILAGFVLIQLPVSGGIILLSLYTLADSNALHMTGSYMLFIAGSLGQVIAIMLTTAVLALMQSDPAMRELGLIHAGAARLRIWVAALALLLAVSYLALFVLKDTSLGSPLLYQTYVTLEVVLVACLMGALMFHAVEFTQILMRRRGQSGAASRRPARSAEER